MATGFENAGPSVDEALARLIAGNERFDPQLSPDDRLARAVESNVRWTVDRIVSSPEGQARRAEGRAKIVGAIYEIATGRVRLLPRDAS